MSKLLHRCLYRHLEIEIATTAVGFLLISMYGTGFVQRREVLFLGLAALAAGIGLDQYASRKLGLGTQSSNTE